MSSEQTRERIAGTLGEPLAAVGFDVEAVELSQAGKRRVLRVAVDRDGGVTLDDIATATREVSRVLDESDVLGERPYVLEVSSPGTDRPLRLPRHWRRNRGRLVAVSLHDGRSLTGRVTDSDEDGAVLEVDGDRQEVGFAEVARATVQVELRRAPDPFGDAGSDQPAPGPGDGVAHGKEPTGAWTST